MRVREARSEFPGLSVERCCRAAGIARSTYYRSPAAKECPFPVEALEDVLARFPGYGYRRASAALGLPQKRARVWMRRLGLSRARKPARRNSTIPGKLQGGANLVRGTRPTRLGETLVADVSCVRFGRGRWGYVAVVLDAFSRQVAGWALSSRNDVGLAKDALLMALSKPGTAPGWTHHSDRGSAYASHEYRRLVAAAGGRSSYSDPASPTQNAIAESFFKTFKLEEAGREAYGSPEEAREAFAAYFALYNSERLHSSLGMKSPDQFAGENP